MPDPIIVNSRVWVPSRALSMTAVRASGPGGQNVNKVASKVELRIDLSQVVGLNTAQTARLRALASHRLDSDGQLRVTSQRTRDQSRNLADARRQVRELIARSLVLPKTRKTTRVPRRAIQKRLRAKRQRSLAKQDRAWKPE